MNKIKAYIDEVIKEMRKVNWPKQSELIDNTVVTLIGTLLIGVFIFGADRFISFVLGFIYT
ncbi:MAG TPA: preprotein translocase subunit SecE [Rhodothermales bacterium]|nr:preprotein translocase subunit SecE [Rhodothermales bacterium]